MAATCVVRPSNVGHDRDSRRPKIQIQIQKQKSTTGWAENRQFDLPSEVRNAGTYPSRIGGTWRYRLHTANSSSPPTVAARSTNSTPISRTTPSSTDIHTRVSVLVAELLYSIAHSPAACGSLPSGYNDEDSSPSDHHYHDETLARACIVSDVSAPPSNPPQSLSSPLASSPIRNMDFGFDWGGSGGFQTRGKKKKAAPVAKFDLGDNNDEKKDDTGANGGGGSDDLGGSGGGASGAGGGGDDNNGGGGGGGGDDDDAWGFSTGKKTKKKTKKQLEEEEEERKRKEKEEEDAQAAAATNTNALSWAEPDEGNTNEDWTMSWGGTKVKDKKKKKPDPPPAVPDAPSATSAFQDISLDDGAPKLEFSFDNSADTKKPETGSGFGQWGKTWDFGSIGKEEKKEETSDFGGNNPWGFGSKTKKKTTTSSFDFGTDFGSSTNNDLNFDATDDVAESKPADDAWGFGGLGKKDKKKKAVEEIKEEPEPEPEQKEDTWGTWGTATTAKKTVKKKKNAFDDAFALTEEEPATNGDSAFDWGFGSKDKKKDLIGEIDDKPAEKQDEGDDLLSGAWGAVGKKKNNKKKTVDDVSAFLDTTSNVDTKASEPANDPWSSFSSKKDQKSKKGFSLDDDFLVEEAEPSPEPEPIKEPLVVWDFGLNAKDRKKKQKAMQLDGSWEARITQEMVDAAEAQAANPEPELEPEPESFAAPEPEPEPIPERVPWDHGLDAKARRKKQKEMQLAGTWADRLTQDKIDEEKAAIAAAAAAAFQDPEPEIEPYEDPLLDPESEPVLEPQEDVIPPEDLVPWDHNLNAKEKKKKEKQMRLDGLWDDRLTQDMIDEQIMLAKAAAEAAAAIPEPEPEAFLEPESEPTVEPEADQTPLEDLRAWDAGLSPKEKKRKEKQMKLDGSWEARLTEEMIEEMMAAAAAKAEEANEPEPEPIPEPEFEPEPEPELEPVEEKKPWDDGLSPKEKKRKEKQMKLDGTWETRLTQEMIDDEIFAAAAAKEAEPEPEPEPIVEPEPEPEHMPEPIEAKKPWDDGLTPKEKKKKERQMKLDGTWETRLTQEMIDDEIAAAAAAKEAEPDPEPIIEAEPELEPEPEVVVEERKPWDYGLVTKVEKKRREREMKASGTWDDRLTQEMIDADADAEAAAEPEPEPEPEEPPPPPIEVEPRFPWDHGLSIKEKKKKEKEMKLNGTWNDRLTQEQIDADAAAAAATAVEPEPEPFVEPEPEPEPEPVGEEPAGWSFGWGGSKTKVKKKPVPEPEPSPQEEKVDEGWSGSWGLGFGKDKKKKKETTPTEPELIPEPEPISEPEPEPVKEEKKDDIWSFATPSTATSSKKKKEKSARKSDFFDPIIEEAVPEPEPEPTRELTSAPAPIVEDMWAQFGKSDKPDKKSTKKSKKTEEAPPPVPSPPAFGFSPEPEPEVADIPSVDDFNWGGLDNGRKSNKSLISEAPAKKSASSMWGLNSTTSSAKTKKELKAEKEAKAKKEAEEQAQREEEERLQREAEEAEAAEEAAKAAKKSKSGKLSKASKAVEEKKKSSDLMDLLDEPIPTPASSSSKLKKASARSSVNKIEVPQEVPEEEQQEATDYFSFWGATSNAKKTGGKRSPVEVKKEVKTPVLTNEEDALLAGLNEDEIQAILDDAPIAPTPKLSRTTSNSKSARSSINNRIDAFEIKKEKTGRTPKTSETVLINGEAEREIALTPKELKKATKGKSSARSSRVQFETPPSPEPEPIPIEKKKSKDSVPGSFPGEFADEEDDAMLTAEEVPMSELEPESESEPEPVREPIPEPIAVKSKLKKASKVVEKKPTKAPSKKKPVVEKVVPAFDEVVDFVAEPEPIDELDLLDDPPSRLPTPPIEEETKPVKPLKKERARVERSATGSWALWGAQPTPKKPVPVRSKTADDLSPPSSKKAKSPPVMVRPKAIKTPKNEDIDDSKNTEPTSKTSGSDRDSSSKPSDKSKPRGVNLTNFMLGAPPSAMRNGNLVRRSSTTGSKSGPVTPSRRQSLDYNGPLSPPPDESPVARKAAALMGYAVGKPSRRSSVKGKTSSYLDPYPIDDDDVVMVNTRAKEPEPIPGSKPKNRITTETKRSSTKPRSKTISGDEDVVMVDSPMAMESDVERPFERPQLQRSNTSRSSKSFFGSFFSPGVRTPIERPRSTQVTDNEETTPRVRSRNHSRKRSRVVSPVDGFTTDAHGETDADAARRRARRAAKEKAEEDERQARESRRRERREREKADLEARQQRAREQARKEREAEEQRKEERRARRREKEDAERARVAQEEAEAEAAAERKREERRRLREKLEAEAAINTLGKDERRRTYGGEEGLRRAAKAERTSRTKTTSGRRSTALMAEYHESRNGSGRGIKPPADKTSSWIDSQQDEPPELPPFEGTVLDESGQRPRPVDDSDPRRRRKDKYAGMTEEEIARHRAKRRERRIVEKSTSGGSDEKQAAPIKKSSKRQSRIYEDDYYVEPVRTFDGRPQQTKRSSFLGKFF